MIGASAETTAYTSAVSAEASPEQDSDSRPESRPWRQEFQRLGRRDRRRGDAEPFQASEALRTQHAVRDGGGARLFERPTFIATIGFGARARRRSKPETLSKPSMCGERDAGHLDKASAITDRQSAPGCPQSSKAIGSAARMVICRRCWMMRMIPTPAAFGQAHAAMLVGPQKGTVGIVDQPVAVRPDDRHVTGRLDQLALQSGAVLFVTPRLQEAGRKADRPAGALFAKLTDDVDGEAAVDADEDGIGRGGEFRRFVGLRPSTVSLPGTGQIAGKAILMHRLTTLRRRRRADDATGGAEEAFEAAGRAPSLEGRPSAGVSPRPCAAE